MYLGDDRLNSLACYVQGAIHGIEDLGVRGTPEEKFLNEFGEWLGKRFDSSNGDCWFYLMRCYPEATGNITDFYKWLDRYLEHKGFTQGLDDEKLDAMLAGSSTI
jgi:hypothetical protein